MGVLVWYGVWGYEYVCGGFWEDLRKFFLNLFFSFFLFIMEPFSFLHVIFMFASRIFLIFSFKIPSFFFKTHFPPVICFFSFSCKYFSCFRPPSSQPKARGTVTNRNSF